MAHIKSRKQAHAQKRRPAPSPILIAIALLASGASHAQTAVPNANPEGPSLPAVTVTSEKDGTANDGYLAKKITGVGIWGERSLQDTPYSMTVIPSELIENSNAKDMDQIFKMIPTTQETANYASDATDNAWVTIRGFQVTNPIINGIPYVSRVAGTPMMQDIERVEVINGATGFLYGGGRVGGAVNYITKKPTLESLKQISVGSYGGKSYFGHAELSGQFDQNNVFGYRLSALYQNGETAKKEKRKIEAASFVVDFKPNNNLYADLKFSHKSTVNPGPTIFWATNGQIDRSRTGIGSNQSYTPEWLKQEFRSNKIESSVKWNINDVATLRSSVFHEEVDKTGGDARMRYLNNTVLATSWFGDYAWQQNTKNGLNVYLDSKFNIFGISNTLTVGYSTSSDKIYSSTDNSKSYYTTADMSLEAFRNFAQPAGWGNVGLTPRTASTKTTFDNILIGNDIKFNDQWSALIGGNYATTKSLNYRTNVNYSKSAFTPTLSLIYKPVNRLTTYATYIESLEAGSIVGNGYMNENQVLAPYISKQYEIGAKYALSDRALLNVALFRIEKANSYEIGTTPKPTLSQDGKQVHQGIEVGITGKVTDNLTILAGGTWMDLGIKKATDKSLEGKKPTSAASKLAKITAEYRIPGIPGLSVSGGIYYTGTKYSNAANTDIIPAYTLFDAGLRYTTRIGNHATTFNFTVQNITDVVYWSNNLALGDPRTFAFTVKTLF